MLDCIKKSLSATADKLRANMDVPECKHQGRGLNLVKYISDTFAVHRAELVRGNLLPRLISGQLRVAEITDPL